MANQKHKNNDPLQSHEIFFWLALKNSSVYQRPGIIDHAAEYMIAFKKHTNERNNLKFISSDAVDDQSIVFVMRCFYWDSYAAMVQTAAQTNHARFFVLYSLITLLMEFEMRRRQFVNHDIN